MIQDYSLQPYCGTQTLYKATVQFKQPISEEALKGYCFILFLIRFTTSPFVLVLLFLFCFFSLPELLSEMRQHGGWRCTAVYDAHENVLWNYREKEGDTAAVFVLRETGE